jgi:amino acid transporter
MRKYLDKIGYFLIIFLLMPVSKVFAATGEVKIGVEIPGTICTKDAVVDLNTYISCWYRFLTFLVFGAAIIMLAYGGYKYISSQGNPDALKDAKDVVFAAIAGIVIMALGYLILSTISPDIVTNIPVSATP